MLTICLTTLREEPRFDLLVNSLLASAQAHPSILWELLVVDGQLWYMPGRRESFTKIIDGRIPQSHYRHVEPKPSVWQGPNRLTKTDFWDACSARNTAFCYARGRQVVFIDDCFSFGKDWLEGHLQGEIRGATYVGPFHDVGDKPEDCDHRIKEHRELTMCPPGWSYGMNVGVPLDATIAINGYDEAYSGQAGVEDVDLGVRLGRSGIETWFDPTILVTQHRETHVNVCRPKPKERKLRNGLVRYANEFLIQRLFDEPTRRHTIDKRYDLRDLRKKVELEVPFPIPDMPDTDWRDGQLLRDMR